MKKVSIIILLLSLALYLGCQRGGGTYLAFDDIEHIKSIPNVYEINGGEKLNIDKFGLLDICVVDSSLLLSSSDSKSFISAVNPDDGSIESEYFRQGNGPGELLYAVYFSSGKVRKNDSTFMYILDQKGNLLEWNITASKVSPLPKVSVRKDSIPSNLFYALYINDSTFLCREINAKPNGQTRFIMAGAEKRVNSSMQKLNSVTIPGDGDPYLFNIVSSFSNYNVEKDVVVEASLMLNTINLYSVFGDFEKTVCYGKKPDNVNSVYYKGLNGLQNVFLALRSYGDYFVVLYSGGPEYPLSLDDIPEPKLLFFNWEGEALAELRLKDKITSFDIDIEKGILYTLNTYQEEVKKYDVKSVIEKIDILQMMK